MATPIVVNGSSTASSFNLVHAGESGSLVTVLTLLYVGPLIAWTLLSNAFVVVAVARHRPLRIAANLLLGSLAGTDLLMGAVVMPVAYRYSIVGRWDLGPLGCKVRVFLQHQLVLCMSMQLRV